MSGDVGKTTEGLENELWRWWSDGKVGEWAEFIDAVNNVFFIKILNLLFIQSDIIIFF